jgi:enolase
VPKTIEATDKMCKIDLLNLLSASLYSNFQRFNCWPVSYTSLVQDIQSIKEILHTLKELLLFAGNMNGFVGSLRANYLP